MFKVKIKREVFQTEGMGFLAEKEFSPYEIYSVVAVIGNKLLIVHERNGEFVELYPRNCYYVYEEV